MLEAGVPDPGHLGRPIEFPRLDNEYGRAHSTGKSCLLRVPKFVWGSWAFHSATSTDSMALIAKLVAGEVGEELLGATRWAGSQNARRTALWA